MTPAISRAGLLRALLLATLFGGPALPFARAEQPLRPERLRAGFLESAFRHMNRNDAQAAFKVFAQTAGRKRGYELSADVLIFNRAEDLLAAGQTGAVDVAWSDAWDYARVRGGERLQPAFFSSWDGTHVERTYRLFVSRKSAATSLADLRGRSLVALSIIATDTSERWLESLLLTNGLGRPEAFFSKVEVVERASAAVLPVFFGQKDACLVDEAGFTLMTELNPQVGTGLRPLESSEPLASSVICLATNGWSTLTYERDLREALRDLHLEPDGQQILTLFKCGRLQPYDDRRLDSLRRLRATLEGVVPGRPKPDKGAAP